MFVWILSCENNDGDGNNMYGDWDDVSGVG